VTGTLLHPNGETETLRVGWLLGCDGAHSVVRKGLGWDFGSQALEHGFAVGDLHVDWALPRQEGRVFLHPSGIMSAYPFGVDRWRVTVQVAPHAGDGPTRSPPWPTSRRGWRSEARAARRSAPRAG
jgi:2-polyprenyl-6-methoxyphenol hydroxylase-like FAD-dependent oxidoreductase